MTEKNRTGLLAMAKGTQDTGAAESVTGYVEGGVFYSRQQPAVGCRVSIGFALSKDEYMQGSTAPVYAWDTSGDGLLITFD